MIKRKNNIYYLASIIYMIVSVILGLWLLDGLIIFLAWNMFLATIVFLLSEVITNLFQKEAKKRFILPVFVLWVLFFPNSIYILTDFIHFQNYDFFTRYSDIYNFDLDNWFVFAHITVGGLYAAKLGIKAINNIEPYLKKITKKYYYLFLTFLFILSSVGIFIGRFLRFNSWDILQFTKIIYELLSHGLFMYVFIILFTIIHWVSYLLFSNNK